MDDDDEVICI